MITSVSNAKIKRLVLLKDRARVRNEEKVCVIEGERLFLDAPKEDVLEIYISEGYTGHNKEKIFKEYPGSKVETLSKEVFLKASDTKSPQGIIAVIKQRTVFLETLFTEKNPVFIYLDGVQDPGNAGAIFRSAEASGITGVILSSGCVDVYAPKTLRAAMGGIFRVPFVKDMEHEQFFDLFSKKYNNYNIYAADVSASSVSYIKADYKIPSVVVIGNEGNGISQSVKSLCTGNIHIPMLGKTESLNAAVSASLIMYEAARQKFLI